MNDFTKLFKKSFGLPWKNGGYHQTTFTFNPSPYSMKVLHIKDSRPNEKFFVSVPKAKVASLVFGPSSVDESQTAVVGAKIGSGFLVYVGDVNPEEGSNKVILTLYGL
ncbi:hypothetical protein EYZ11_004260 [Aspergillus tanneri]|uniref:Uncharacterized protein n=1 Tax=Aspergillus tanneri TaxID=1220188 RepID=A0A4S3JND9_9EURO|nr:uncharacterized protein ATNIH1004_010919 [Aspergillus tanneri]KAA8641980.1 hypothetical protein ATNIH1004_010919 [Aspergillus tanneri]THC96267.1 hypothetical protein EYZ11_004260 [Aspergillus tanneri]